MGAEELKIFLISVSKFLMVLFIAVYSYQVVYCFIPFLFKSRKSTLKKERLNRFAVLIAARNEENVIGELIKSIRQQTYDHKLISIFVVADNCTDKTAQVAAAEGAVVFERFNKVKVGKSYALEYLLNEINKAYPERFDGYMVFDADNLLERTYVAEMNKTFNEGYEIITSYRNSKNYGRNWISAGYALWFLKDSKFLNEPRMILGKSSVVTGTGFLFSDRILQKTDGWKFHLLTEDLEFSTYHVLDDVMIGYCKDAVFYDEQPESFSQSWNQRLRWIKGYFQVFRKYKWQMLKKLFKTGDFTYYDLLMLFIPAFIISALQCAVNILILLLSMGDSQQFISSLIYITEAIAASYAALFALGALTTVCEWKNIYTGWRKKILYTFTFPIFVFTYFPIACAALFAKVEWKPIMHKHRIQINDIYKS